MIQITSLTRFRVFNSSIAPRSDPRQEIPLGTYRIILARIANCARRSLDSLPQLPTRQRLKMSTQTIVDLKTTFETHNYDPRSDPSSQHQKAANADTKRQYESRSRIRLKHRQYLRLIRFSKSQAKEQGTKRLPRTRHGRRKKKPRRRQDIKKK